MHSARRNRQLRLVPALAIAAIGAVVAAVLIPLSAQAETVALSGVVRNAAGTALPGVIVTPLNFSADPSGPVLEPTIVTSATGSFAFGALPLGEYTLSFSATSSTYFQYLGGSTDLNDRGDGGAIIQMLELLGGAGGDHSYLNATLSASGGLAGKVSRLPSGALDHYTVRAYEQAADGSWSIERSTTTTSTGSYSLSGLKPDNYRVEAIDLASAHPLYAPAFSGGAADLDSAASVGVAAGKNTAENFALGHPGSASGTVTGLWGGANVEHLAGVHVTAYRMIGPVGSFTSGIALDSPSATTSATGAYSITGLAAGSYTLEFTPSLTPSPAPAGTVYGRNFLGNSDSPVSAPYFTIGNGTAIAGQNIQLTPAGTVQGAIERMSDSTAIGGIRVSIDYSGQDQDAPSEHAQSMLTNGAGQYLFRGLGPGTYDLWVGSNDGSNLTNPSSVTNFIRQVVTVSSLGAGENRINVDAAMVAKDPGGLQSNPAPAIHNSGETDVGDQLSVDPGTWNAPVDPATQVQYQWLRNGVPIAGATGQSYMLQPADVNTSIDARVTASDFQYGTGTTFSPGNAGTIGYGTLLPGLVSVSGSSVVGQTLTVQPGDWQSPGGITGVLFTYQWQVSPDGSSNWVNVGEPATGPTHVVTALDLADGNYLRVQLTGHRQGFSDLEMNDEDFNPLLAGEVQSVAAPSVKKTTAGFSLAGGTWNPSTFDTSTVAWTVYAANGTFTNPTPVVPTLLPLAGTAGDWVTVSVTHTLAGYTSGSTATLIAQVGTAPVATGPVGMGGTPQVGHLLVAPTPNWLPNSGTSTYQWQYKSGSAWKSIVGATGSDYTPIATDLGHLLRVVTTQHTTGYATATLVANAATPVAPGDAPFNSQQGQILGSIGTADVVTYTTGTWSPLPTKFTVQWEYSVTGSAPYVKIPGATGTSFTIPQNLVGDYLFFDLTGTTPGYLPTSVLMGDVQVGSDHLNLLTAPKVVHSGNVYTASGAKYAPAADAVGGVSYDWYYTDPSDTPTEAIGDTPATNSSTILLSDYGPLNAHWYVVACGTVAGPPNYGATCFPPVLVKVGSLSVGSPITLPASQVGQAITPNPISWNGFAAPTLAHQWQYLSGSTWKWISGATAATFTPSSTYLGKQVRVVVTASHANYTSSTVDSFATTVAAGATPVSGSGPDAPEIFGAGIGSTMTVLPGTWNLTGLTYHYQWASSPTGAAPWTNVVGATSATYKTPDALYGDYVQVTITASRVGFAGVGTATAESSQIGTGVFAKLTPPKVTLAAGKYTVSTGTWSPTGGAFTYDWEIFDRTTDSSTQVSTTNSYTLQPGDAGKEIQVTVFPNSPAHYNTLGATVTAQLGSAIGPVTPLSLTGTPVVGGTLTANFVDWNTPIPGPSITWYRNGVATGTFINNPNYTLTAADLGKTISVKFAVTKSGYIGSTFTFASTPTFSDFVLAPISDPVIDGTVKVDSTVTASTGTWNSTGLSYAYQWYRSGAAIPGAVSSSYLVAAADEGDELTVGVTASKPFFTPVSQLSQDATVQPGDNMANLAATPIKITGTVGLTHVLTATIGAWNFPATVVYQWKYSADGGATWNAIPSAQSITYTPVAIDGLAEGNEIELEVSASRPGHSTANLVSAPLTL